MKVDKLNKKLLSGGILLGIIFLVICALPYFLTRPGLIDFTGTGPIGDTIGGIMGPFIAIVAAILTFLAFWVQYKANEQLRNDISLERFEGRFYKMLDIHIQNVENLKSRSDGRENNVFELLIRRYEECYRIVFTALNEFLNDRNWGVFTKGENPYVDYLRSLYENENKKKEEACTLAYGYFFYGVNYSINRNYGYIAKLNEILNTRMDMKRAAHSSCNEAMGHYYRHLYQTVRYVANMNDAVIDEQQKYEYVKMLRAQMSDTEQLLLYYNSLSIPGRNWNKSILTSTSSEYIYRQNMGYIARFRLIKNLTNVDQIVGLNPKDKYSNEIAVYSSHKQMFFEQE